jgi:hypothetical protein
MIYRKSANCQFCSHFLGEQKCEAFPEGIPEVLWSGDNLHRTPFANDNGITFAPKPVSYEALQSIMKDLGL